MAIERRSRREDRAGAGIALARRIAPRAVIGSAIAAGAIVAPAILAVSIVSPQPARAGESAIGFKGHLSARYAYVGSSSPATASSGARLAGSSTVSALSGKLSLSYRSRHWMSFERPAASYLESPFENRSVIQTLSIDTDGLIRPGIKTRAGRFAPGISYGSSPIIDGGALSWTLGAFTVCGAGGRAVDLWSGESRSSDPLTAAAVQYRTSRASASIGFQRSSYGGRTQREVPAGFSFASAGGIRLEVYAGYDFGFDELARAGAVLSVGRASRSFSLSLTQWRNPLDQLYMRSRMPDASGEGAAPSDSTPSTYRDVRASASIGGRGWSARSTLGLMAGIRSGWVMNANLSTPSLRGFAAGFGIQAVSSDYIELYSLDALISLQARDLLLRIESKTRNYLWSSRPSDLHITDNYSEISAEYPIARHVYVSVSAGGTFRTLGNEGFTPQAELRLIARM